MRERSIYSVIYMRIKVFVFCLLNSIEKKGKKTFAWQQKLKKNLMGSETRKIVLYIQFIRIIIGSAHGEGSYSILATVLNYFELSDRESSFQRERERERKEGLGRFAHI